MAELTPWPYGAMPSIHDVTIGGVRRVIQHTEDGYYGFAFRSGEMVLSMVGPIPDADACLQRLRRKILIGGYQDRD